ncbi:MAG: ATP-binding protein [Phocaeicola sp.]
MNAITRRYPVGIQTFSEIIELNCVYVDKTALIHRMVHESGKSYFLTRPRRFGKSLLISTLQAYFEGRKELFKGLAMEQLESEWKVYPVLRLDLSRSKYTSIEELNSVLEYHLRSWEKRYGALDYSATYTARFASVIERAYEQTGQKVVVLIDEYDSALIDSNNTPELQQQLRNTIRSFYSPLKSADPYLRFLFLTGITKFSQMSIFSELNNLNNISMMPEYDTICGISEEELYTQLEQDIRLLAQRMNTTEVEMKAMLKKQYDGYHFSEALIDIYNPFSLITAFANKRLASYWFSTGTPTFLIELLQREGVHIPELDGIKVKALSFDQPTEQITNVLPVLYQSGYLTIKGYDSLFDTYTLGYPNQEVRIGFLECLVPNYVHVDRMHSDFLVIDFLKDLMANNIEQCLTRMQTFFADIPYVLENKSEKHYQTIFYILFKLMGQYVDVEIYTATGRIDAMIALKEGIYLFEFKLDQSAAAALEQIESKEYAIKYQLDSRPLYKIGVNFSSEKRTLTEWIVK